MTTTAYTNRETGNTITKRRELAKRARQYGHFANGRKLWNRCPLCGTDVHGQHYYGYSVAKSLDADMMMHLEDCIDDRAQGFKPNNLAGPPDLAAWRP